jgi:YD repeat-containing protein
MLSRDKKHWTGTGGIEYPAVNSYINNRNTVWSYDAAGNLLQTGRIPSISYQYDAAGRMTHSVSDLTVDITQTYDGDRQVLKRYEVDTIYEDGGSSHTETNTLYQLRSSALGGKVLTEVGAQGQKARTYVYADGALLAWQTVMYANGGMTAQLAVWEHRDPSNASYRTSQQTSADPETWAELDSFGSNAGLENPYQTNPPPQNHKPNIFYPAFVLSSDGRCRVDSVDENCTHAGLVLRAHAGDVDPNTTSPSDAGSVGAKPIYGSFCVTVSAGGKVETECRTEVTGYTSSSSFSNNLSLLPQNSERRLTTDETSAVRNGIADLLSDPNCQPFINELLGKASEQNKGNPPFSTDPLKLFDEINSRGGYNYSTHYGFNTVSSNLQYPNAAVLLVPPSSFGPGRWPGREQYIANEIAGAGLHETLHLAGRSGQYSDVALARATMDIAAARGWKLPSEADRQKILSDEFAASYYWGGILRSKCKPSSERH